eukprot:Skav216033  [mRNA]  locus=scaffold2403:24889:31312:+ [translate_table: standard]
MQFQSYACESDIRCFLHCYGLNGFGKFWSIHQTWFSSLQSLALAVCKIFVVMIRFDATLGFPGEGPWSVASLNIGSLEKHPEAVLKGFDCLLLQETRITDGNLKHLSHVAADKGFQLNCGPTMKYLASGSPEWGGVACATTPGSSRIYTTNDDCTGIYASLLATNRVLGMWVAADNGTLVLVFNLYLFSGAPSDSDKHCRNNTLIQQTLEVIAQHGAIPAIIAGDFQDMPHCYPVLRDAFAEGLWFDILLQHDEQNGMSRPTTFARDKHWNNMEYSSSIDGILVNQTAYRYVNAVEVQHALGLQHAYVIASFQFGDNCERPRGYVWHPHAALDLTKLKSLQHRDQIAEQLWNDKYEFLANNASTGDDLLNVCNDFSIEVLIVAGATWKHGKQTKGSMPEFSTEPRRHAKSAEKDQNCRQLSKISKAMARLDDLAFKIHNCPDGSHAYNIATTAWTRVSRLLTTMGCENVPCWPVQDDITRYWDFLQDERDKVVRKIRYQRIKNWRNKIAASAMSSSADIFQYLKRKHNLPQHHVTTDSEGKPFYQPRDALAFARQQWNNVFDFHREPVPTGPIMRVLGNDFARIKSDCTLPPLCEDDLRNSILDRKREAAAGVDGWRTVELQALPWRCFTPWVMLWTGIEDGRFQMPGVFKIAKLVMLPKPEAKTLQPIHKRLISLLNIHYLAWARSRFMHLEQWQLRVLPSNIMGGVKGKKTSDVFHHLAIMTERATLEKVDAVGIKLDRTKCFDRICPKLIEQFGTALGIDPKFFRVWGQLYEGFQRYLSLGAFIDECALANANGVAQGDSASDAKKWVECNFPALPINDMINILGSMVKTSRGTKTVDGATLAYVMKTTILDIGCLPIDLEKKGFLIAAKAVAKLLYAPELMPWPKLTLDSMVTTIARALWGNRPHWRSTELLYATCTNAATTHPILAIASRIFANICNRCRTDEKFACLWFELCQTGRAISKGLLDTFVRACATLGFEFVPPFQVSFLGIRFCLHSVYPKHIRRICRVASAQSLYSSALRSARKDLETGPTGIMDVEMTPPGTRFEPWRRLSGYDPAIIPGALTGAAPTADRLFHANLLGSQQCRWCGAEKETIQHLAGKCDKVNEVLGRPLLPLCDQPNLATHGIFEVPHAVISHELRQWNGDDLPPRQVCDEQITLWGDGSIANADHFYSKTMGFAVVNAAGEVIYRHGLQDPMACSFKAELCALVAAFRMHGPRINFVTDCKSLRNVFLMIRDAGYVPMNLSFSHWWKEIFDEAGFGNMCRLAITWVRAHRFDHSLAGIDMLHLHNLYADRAAREAALSACPVACQTVKAWRRMVITQQAWLCRLMKLITAQKDLDNAANLPGVEPMPDDVSGEPLEQQLRNKFSGETGLLKLVELIDSDLAQHACHIEAIVLFQLAVRSDHRHEPQG